MQNAEDASCPLFQQRSEDWAESQVGRELDVMVDAMEGTDAIGRTEHDALDIDGTVRIPATPLVPGTVLRVRVLAAEGMDLIAQPVL